MWKFVPFLVSIFTAATVFAQDPELQLARAFDDCDFDLVQGIAIDPPASSVEIVAFNFEAAVQKNFSMFMNPRRFIPEDWNMGVPMLFPVVGRPAQRLADLPSLFARKMLRNRGGHATFPLRVFNPETGVYQERRYPVLRLNPQTGNPVLLVQPNDHIFVPTKAIDREASRYSRATVDVITESALTPVKVQLYGGENHRGQIVQLVVQSRHDLMDEARRRGQPVHIEVTGVTGYVDPLYNWHELAH